jgi:hypothetical protein
MLARSPDGKRKVLVNALVSAIVADMRYFVQQRLDGGNWCTLAAYEDVERAVALCKVFRAEDIMFGRPLETLVVDEETERTESGRDDLSHIEAWLAKLDEYQRTRFDRLADAGRPHVTAADIAEFIWPEIVD